MISVIVPVYNSAKYIRETIDSILAQDYKDYEVICVDNGSSDESLDILKSYESQGVRVYEESRKGAPFARNRGIVQANGDYIIFFDGDDLMEKECLSTLINKADGCDLVIGNTCSFRSGNGTVSKEFNNVRESDLLSCDEITIKKKLMSLSPFPGNKLYSAEVIRKNNLLFDDVPLGQDLAFYYKFLCVCHKAALVEKTVSRYRLVGGSISHSAENTDISKSFNRIIEFYSERESLDMYEDILYSQYVLHLSGQFMKYSLIKDSQKRKETFYSLSEKILTIHREKKDILNSEALKYAEWIQNKKAKSFIYLNPIYLWAHNKYQKIKKNDMWLV